MCGGCFQEVHFGTLNISCGSISQYLFSTQRRVRFNEWSQVSWQQSLRATEARNWLVNWLDTKSLKLDGSVRWGRVVYCEWYSPQHSALGPGLRWCRPHSPAPQRVWWACRWFPGPFFLSLALMHESWSPLIWQRTGDLRHELRCDRIYRDMDVFFRALLPPCGVICYITS